MHHDTPGVEPDSDEVDSRDAGAARQPPDVPTLFLVDCIDGVTAAADSAHLHCHQSVVIRHQEIDLAPCDLDIAGHEAHALFRQPPCCETLTRRTNEGAASAQSLSSVFSSFSTFTSRKVRTWTCSRNLAGRNISQTQASFMSTSK